MDPPICRWSSAMAAESTSTSHLTPSDRKRAYWSCGVDRGDKDRAGEEAGEQAADDEDNDCGRSDA